jgi:hypothetical protein
MADVVWPVHILPPAGGRVSINSATIGGGRAMSGLEQAVASDAGYLSLKMGPIYVNTAEQVRAWNALEAVLGGRAGTCLVPALDRARAPWPTVAGKNQFARLTKTTIAEAVEGTAPMDVQVISAVADGAFTAGATNVSIRLVIGSQLQPGHQFSCGERLFRIAKILSEVEDTGNSIYYVRLALPVRDAVADGASLNFDNPMFRAVLATDGEMALDLDMMKRGRATLNWVEDV